MADSQNKGLLATDPVILQFRGKFVSVSNHSNFGDGLGGLNSLYQIGDPLGHERSDSCSATKDSRSVARLIHAWYSAVTHGAYRKMWKDAGPLVSDRYRPPSNRLIGFRCSLCKANAQRAIHIDPVYSIVTSI